MSDENFTSKCNEATLQQSNRGFFLQFANNVIEIVGQEWISKKFAKLSDGDKLRSLYEHEPIKEAIIEVFSNVREVYRKKSSEIAAARRKEAEKAQLGNNLIMSLSLFSQSVLRAEMTGANQTIDRGNSLSLALLGRSKILVEMEKFDFALNDLQQALKENLPDSHKIEAYFLLAVCYKAAAQDKKAEVALNLSRKLFGNNESEFAKTFMKRFELFTAKRCENEQNQSRKAPPKISVDKLEIKESKSLGRHVIAKENLKVGETLVVEKPVAACLKPEYAGTHCQNCFVRLVAPIGCPTCSNVAFCGQVCKEEALSSYHRFECKLHDLLLGAGLSALCHLALRMVTQNELESNLKMHENRKNERVFSLCTNRKQRNPNDFFRRALMAAFLSKCLRVTGYFGKNNENDGNSVMPHENELKIGEILLFYLQMLQFNAHEIYAKIHRPAHRFKQSKIENLAIGLYPTVALFNHSCYPSVTRYFVGKTIVINTVKPVKSGEMVAENYGPIFTKKTLKERQSYLKSRYWFDCQCIACLQNWPKCFDSNTKEFTNRIRCGSGNCEYFFTPNNVQQKEIMKCPRCGLETNLNEKFKEIEKCEEEYHSALVKMDEMKPYEGIPILEKALERFHVISVVPQKSTHLAEETLKALFADLGNAYESF